MYNSFYSFNELIIYPKSPFCQDFLESSGKEAKLKTKKKAKCGEKLVILSL